jgi:hypothetical protein
MNVAMGVYLVSSHHPDDSGVLLLVFVQIAIIVVADTSAISGPVHFQNLKMIEIVYGCLWLILYRRFWALCVGGCGG